MAEVILFRACHERRTSKVLFNGGIELQKHNPAIENTSGTLVQKTMKKGTAWLRASRDGTVQQERKGARLTPSVLDGKSSGIGGRKKHLSLI